MGVPLDDRPVLERPRFALIGITAEVDRFGRLLGQESPLHAGDKSSPTATAQVRRLHLLSHLFRLEGRQSRARSFVPAVGQIDIELTDVRDIEVAQQHLFSHRFRLIITF